MMVLESIVMIVDARMLRFDEGYRKKDEGCCDLRSAEEVRKCDRNSIELPRDSTWAKPPSLFIAVRPRSAVHSVPKDTGSRVARASNQPLSLSRVVSASKSYRAGEQDSASAAAFVRVQMRRRVICSCASFLPKQRLARSHPSATSVVTGVVFILVLLGGSHDGFGAPKYKHGNSVRVFQRSSCMLQVKLCGCTHGKRRTYSGRAH